MVRALIFVAAFGAVSAQAELQLIPTLSEYQLEGVKLSRLAFQDGNKVPTYQPPRGWDYSGSSERLTLRPHGKSQIEATISRVPLQQPYPFDAENSKKLAAEALALAPSGSSAVTIVSQDTNVLRIDGKDTFQVVLSYNLQGQIFNRSIMFLNCERQQLRFQFSAPSADFKELQSLFQSSLCSWRNL